MSYKRGWSAIILEMTDHIPHTEYIDSDEVIKNITGIDTSDSTKLGYVQPELAARLDYDFVWSICEMPLTKGRITDMGHAEWSNINPQRNKAHCPFIDTDEVLNFNAVEEYGIPNHNDTVSFFKQHIANCRQYFPNSVVPGGRYNSLFSACIRTFGWDMFLNAVADDHEKFDNVLQGFMDITMSEIYAWIDAGVEIFNLHDDICWTSGAVFHPDWYHKYIFPRYKKMLNPLREAGVKIIYTADGTYTRFIDDIARAGADGFVFEPTTSLEYICEKYGQSKVIIGNIDCRILQFGSKEDICNEVKRCVNAGKNCPGYFFAVGNHIPNGIPYENVEYYFSLKEKLGKR